MVDFKGGNSEDFEVSGASLNDFSIFCVFGVILAVEVAVEVAVAVEDFLTVKVLDVALEEFDAIPLVGGGVDNQLKIPKLG